MPLDELASPARVAGENKVSRLLARGELRKIFVAKDAKTKKLEAIVYMAGKDGIPVEFVESKLLLGRACAISRPASVAGLKFAVE